MTVNSSTTRFALHPKMLLVLCAVLLALFTSPTRATLLAEGTQGSMAEAAETVDIRDCVVSPFESVMVQSRLHPTSTAIGMADALNSFTPDTQVHALDHNGIAILKPISQLKVGDKVLAWDESRDNNNYSDSRFQSSPPVAIGIYTSHTQNLWN